MGIWKLADDMARLRCGPLEGELELNGTLGASTLGAWTTTAVANHRIVGQELRAHAEIVESKTLDWKLVDCYTRTQTLSLTYEARGGEPLRLHFDWHAGECVKGAAILDLVASLQTDRLYIAPSLRIVSQRRQEDDLVLPWSRTSSSEALSAWRTPSARDRLSGRVVSLESNGAAGWRYSELAIPEDFQGSSMAEQSDPAESPPVHWLHEGEPLEKGVIRRLQFRALWEFGPIDSSTLKQNWQEFVSQPPPLTT